MGFERLAAEPAEPVVATGPGHQPGQARGRARAFTQRFSRSFGLRLAWRLALAGLLGASALAAALLPERPLIATIGVLLIALAAVAASAWREVNRTNHELLRLVETLAHEDDSQRFEPRVQGAGFEELAQGFAELLNTQRRERLAAQSRTEHLRALLEQVPIPLVLVDDERAEVTRLNGSARRLFDRAHGARLSDWAGYGTDLVQAFAAQTPSVLVEVQPADDARLKLRLTQARVVHEGRALRLLALQPVQQDLDTAEAALAAGLVRVLSHEVMNSLTPVTSLARTAAELAARDAPRETRDEALLRSSTETLARRAEDLLRFVDGYRQATRVPAPQPATCPVDAWLPALAEMFAAEWPAERVQLSWRSEPAGLLLEVDRSLLEPVLLNLLRNAAQADRRAGHVLPMRVSLRVSLAHSGRHLIDIEDDGIGVPPDLREDVFLPFFSTKPGGQGVGLSLARQVVRAHGGSIHVDASPTLGGARVRIAV
jgi:two-component system, NtrC family, nitrogen regulation sensor histidine kinase NtrY